MFLHRQNGEFKNGVGRLILDESWDWKKSDWKHLPVGIEVTRNCS